MYAAKALITIVNEPPSGDELKIMARATSFSSVARGSSRQLTETCALCVLTLCSKGTKVNA